MKIDVLIVLYNPRKEFLERVVTYCDYFNTVIIFDNTENCDEKRLDFFNFNNCKYISYGKNAPFGINIGKYNYRQEPFLPLRQYSLPQYFAAENM